MLLDKSSRMNDSRVVTISKYSYLVPNTATSIDQSIRIKENQIIVIIIIIINEPFGHFLPCSLSSELHPMLPFIINHHRTSVKVS